MVKGKYNSDMPRPVVLFGYKNLYIKFVGKETKENKLGIILQETPKAYLIRESLDYPNVSKEEAQFTTNPIWYPKSKITRFKEVGTCYNITFNKKIEWRD